MSTIRRIRQPLPNVGRPSRQACRFSVLCRQLASDVSISILCRQLGHACCATSCRSAIRDGHTALTSSVGQQLPVPLRDTNFEYLCRTPSRDAILRCGMSTRSTCTHILIRMSPACDSIGGRITVSIAEEHRYAFRPRVRDVASLTCLILVGTRLRGTLCTFCYKCDRKSPYNGQCSKTCAAEYKKLGSKEKTAHRKLHGHLLALCPAAATITLTLQLSLTIVCHLQIPRLHSRSRQNSTKACNAPIMLRSSHQVSLTLTLTQTLIACIHECELMNSRIQVRDVMTAACS